MNASKKLFQLAGANNQFFLSIEHCKIISLTFLIFLIVGSYAASAETITVGLNGSGTYGSVQEAVSAANAGDTILVLSGTYYENIDVDKQLVITSQEGAPLTSIIAESSGDSVFYISADGVTIDGFSISGASGSGAAGIYVEADNCVLSNNVVGYNNYCVFLDSSSHSTLNNNVLGNSKYSTYGLFLYSSDYNTITENSANRIRVDVAHLENSNFNVLNENTFSGSDIGCGIALVNSSGNKITGNKASSNDDTGIFLLSSDDNELVDNTASYNEFMGISLSDSNDNTLTGNLLSRNVQYGFFIDSSYGNLIYNNNFNNNVNTIFEGTSAANSWDIEKTAGENIIGGDYLAGNYWSSPDETGFSQTATDSDEDGICDSEYYMDDNNIDYLPLMIDVVPEDTDSAAPVLTGATPSGDVSTDDENAVPVVVRFDYSDADSGVDISSVVFTFDGADVTENTTITDSYAAYNAPSLATGSHSASVSVADYTGNVDTFETTFNVVVGSSSSSSSRSSSSSSSSSSSGSSSGSSGGSGGSGGSTTGELSANIIVKEVKSLYLGKDAHVSYNFTEEDNAISSVQFDSLKNSGSIQAIVEVLNDRSSFAESDAPGLLYQQMNIWVGKSGFSSSDNIEKSIISFKVEKSWLVENDVRSEAIVLYRYADDKWNELSTSITDEDSDYVYYESETPGFSPFAISSEETSPSIGEKLKSLDDTASVTDGGVKSVESSPSLLTTAIIIVILCLAVMLIGGFIYFRERS